MSKRLTVYCLNTNRYYIYFKFRYPKTRNICMGKKEFVRHCEDYRLSRNLF